MNDPNKGQKLLEQKIQRLEDLLTQWKEENAEQEKRFHRKLIHGLIKYICILIAALGAIWSVIELADWYWKGYKLNELSKSYIRAADNGYRQTRNPEVALEIINKALALTPDNPGLHYKKIYYQCHKVLKELPVRSYLYSAKDLKKLDMLSAELTLQKELMPDNGELYLLESMLLNKQSDHEQAIKLVEKAISCGAERPYAEKLRIENLLKLNRTGEARDRAKEMLKRYPGNKYILSGCGDIFFEMRQWHEAEKFYLEALKADPEYYEIYKNLITCIRNNIPRNHEKLQKYCKKVLAISPDNWFAYKILIRSYIEEGNYALASLNLTKAERFFQKDGEFYAVQAELYIKERKFELAEQACLKAFQLTPENTNIQRQLVSVYISTENFRKAIEMNKTISSVAAEQNDPIALNNAAWRFFQLGTEYTLAQTISEKAVEKTNNSNFYGTLSSILFRQNKIDQALMYAGKAIETCDQKQKALYIINKALFLMELNRMKEAFSLLLEAEKYSGKYSRLYYAFGKYYVLTGALQKAENMIAEGKKYAVNDNQKTELQIIEAACKAAVGDWSGAERIQKKALQNINNSFGEIRLAYRDYARYCLKSGNKTESARAIDIMKELNPDHPETVQLAKRLQEL